MSQLTFLHTFRLDWRLSLTVLLTVAVLSILQRRTFAAASRKEKQQQPGTGGTGGTGSDYNYKDESEEYSYSDQQSYDYQYQEKPSSNPVDNSILCYSCEFEVLVESNGQKHEEGHPNCVDPFNPFSPVGIPEMKCDGPCSKKYVKSGNYSFRINRGCLPNCKERSEANGYTKCCKSKLCNGYSTSYTLKDHRWLLLLSSLCVIIVAWL